MLISFVAQKWNCGKYVTKLKVHITFDHEFRSYTIANLSCEMQSFKKSNYLILNVCQCIFYFFTCLLLGVNTHLSLIDLYPWSPNPSCLLRAINNHNNWPLVYGLHIPKSSFNDPCKGMEHNDHIQNTNLVGYWLNQTC